MSKPSTSPVPVKPDRRGRHLKPCDRPIPCRFIHNHHVTDEVVAMDTRYHGVRVRLASGVIMDGRKLEHV